jgi:hypothetical protein
MFSHFSVHGEAQKNQKLIITYSAIHLCAYVLLVHISIMLNLLGFKTSHHHHICWHTWCNQTISRLYSSLWYLHLPFLTDPQNSAVMTWCRKSGDHATVRNICRNYVFWKHQVSSTNVLESRWCHPISSLPVPTSASVFEHGRCVTRHAVCSQKFMHRQSIEDGSIFMKEK